MMRIVHVLSGELPADELTQATVLCEHLASDQFESRVCGVQWDFHSRPSADRLCFRSGRTALDPSFLWTFRRLLRDYVPDVVHWWGSTGLRSLLLTRRRHRPPAIVISVPPSFGHPSSRLGVIDRWLIPDLNVVIRDESSLADTRRAGLCESSISVIPYGVAFHRPTATLRPLQAEFGLGTDSVFIATSGVDAARSRVKDLIWALDLLRVIHPEVHLLVMGSGREEARLRDFANAAGTGHAVHFLSDTTRTHELLPQCLCYWCSDPLATDAALLPAMSAGTPVIAADSPHIRHGVREAETGFLVPVGDSAEFARRAKLLVEDRSLASQLGRSGQTLARSSFRLSKMVEGFSGLYERIAARVAA